MKLEADSDLGCVVTEKGVAELKKGAKEIDVASIC